MAVPQVTIDHWIKYLRIKKAAKRVVFGVFMGLLDEVSAFCSSTDFSKPPM